MKRLALILIAIWVGFVNVFSNPPVWFDEKYRDTNFPSDTYYSGFASYTREGNDTESTALSRAEKEAFSRLSQNISTTISSVSKSSVEAVNINGEYTENESFSLESMMTSSANITNATTNSYFDPNAETAYAFVYVKKADLVAGYTNSLDLMLIKSEHHFDNSKLLIERKEKTLAKSECDSIFPLLNKARYFAEMLSIIDKNFNHADRFTKIETMRSNALNLQTSLSQNILVFIRLTKPLKSELSGLLISKIQNGIEEGTCSFTSTESKADYKINITPATRYSSCKDGVHYVYADIEVELYHTYKKSVVFSNSYSQKGAATSETKAYRNAVSKAAQIISEELTQNIK